jgi:phosphoribosylformylglycinamidine cyclo-ligase
VDVSTWTVPPIFRLIAERGAVPRDDLYRTFNMGIGMIVAVAPESAGAAQAVLGGEAKRIGEIVAGEGAVELTGNHRW